MRLSQAKHLLPFVQALAEGRPVQYKIEGVEKWQDITESNVCLFADGDSALMYRIKPTPKLRAWKAEEVPVGALIDVWSGDNSLPSVIVAAEHRSLSTVSGKEIVALTYEECLRDGKYSRDGKTWLPCGIEE